MLIWKSKYWWGGWDGMEKKILWIHHFRSSVSPHCSRPFTCVSLDPSVYTHILDLFNSKSFLLCITGLFIWLMSWLAWFYLYIHAKCCSETKQGALIVLQSEEVKAIRSLEVMIQNALSFLCVHQLILYLKGCFATKPREVFFRI